VLTAAPASAEGVNAIDVAAMHERHGHAQWRQGQGDRGHRWSDYRREARQLRAYLRAVALRELVSCSREPHCAVKLASYLAGANYRLADAIVRCESGYDPSAANPSSSAGGLWQYLSGTWSGVAPIYGMGGRSRFETWPAAWVGANHLARGGTGPWAASAHCWS